MQRLKVLFLCQEAATRDWRNDVVSAVGDRHALEIYDERRPLDRIAKGLEPFHQVDQ